jgi:hypothetical protein
MNRTLKAAQPLVLVVVLFVAGALFGGQVMKATGQLEVAKKPLQSNFVLVDDPKPCNAC